METQRDVKIDITKTIAVFGVIMIHTCSAAFSQNVATFGWMSTAFWGSIVRGSVPLFLMCSGALMLDPARKLPLKKLFTKSLPRLVSAMFFWALLYKIFHLIPDRNFSPQALLQCLKEVLVFNHEFHLYYLHIMLLVYLFLPVTRIIVAHASKEQLEYLLAVWLLLGIVVPTLRPFLPEVLFTGILGQFPINLCYGSIGFGILGYYLKAFPVSQASGIVCAGAGLSITFGATVYCSLQQGWLFPDFLNGNTFGVALLAIGIYGIIFSLKAQPDRRLAQILAYCSEASFCVYLIHVFFLFLLRALGITTALLPSIVSIPLLAALIFALCIPVYYVLSKIPVANRWLI